MTNRYELSQSVDTVIAKALGLSEVSQIARSEARMTKFLLNEWYELVDKAVDIAERKAKAGKNSEEVIASVTRVMKRWSRIVRRVYGKELMRTYSMSRLAAHKKITGQYKGSLQYSESDTAVVKVTKAN